MPGLFCIKFTVAALKESQLVVSSKLKSEGGGSNLSSQKSGT